MGCACTSTVRTTIVQLYVLVYNSTVPYDTRVLGSTCMYSTGSLVYRYRYDTIVSDSSLVLVAPYKLLASSTGRVSVFLQ